MLRWQAASEHAPKLADAAPEDKVAAVCAALRAAMQAAGQRRYLGPILTSHAKQGDLEAALAIVQQLKEEELSASQAQRQQNTAQPATADRASSADGIPGRANGHVDGHAAAAPGDTGEPEAESAADASPAALRGVAANDADDGEDAAAGVPEAHKSWTAEDGLRHLLLYSDVDKLYRCRAVSQVVIALLHCGLSLQSCALPSWGCAQVLSASAESEQIIKHLVSAGGTACCCSAPGYLQPLHRLQTGRHCRRASHSGHHS